MKKKFDAVEESRKWKVETGKKLILMTREERLAYLNAGKKEKLAAMRQQGSKAEQ
jgi:hypothetical protein